MAREVQLNTGLESRQKFNDDYLLDLTEVVADLAAVKVVQDAIIDAADDTARNAVSKVTLGLSMES